MGREGLPVNAFKTVSNGLATVLRWQTDRWAWAVASWDSSRPRGCFSVHAEVGNLAFANPAYVIDE